MSEPFIPTDPPVVLSVQQVITEVMRSVKHVGKDGRNTSQNFSFRGVDAVVNALAPAIREHGLVVRPNVKASEHREITSANGKRQAWVIGTVEYVFTGPGGDSVSATVVAEATDFADKATAKMMSVAYRTALLQVFNLPTDEPDPDAEYVEREAPAHELLQSQIMRHCQSEKIPRETALAKFVDLGGVGKISECADLALLQRLFDALRSEG